MLNATVDAPPSHHRPPARSWSRRLLAALAVVAAVTGSVLAIGSSPATAAGEQADIDRAVFDAQIALLRPACAEYLTGPEFMGGPVRRDPRQVLLTADVIEGPVPAGQPEGALASAPFAAGTGSTITVHPGFFAADPDLPIAPAAFFPSPDQKRIIAILHEVGHLTGREGNHNQNLGRQFAYNATILNLCLADRLPLTPLRITQFTCGPAPLGTGYVRCDVFWAGGVDPASAIWTTPRAPRQPVVTTDPISHITTAQFDCRNPGGPEHTYSTVVQITDSIGQTVSASTIPCGW